MADDTTGLVGNLLRAKARADADMAEAEAEVAAAQSNLMAAAAVSDRIETALGVIEEYAGGSAASAPAAKSIQATFAMPDETPSLTKYGLSIPDGAEIVLREVGQPLRNKQIAERMLAGGFRYELGLTKLRNSVGVMLHRRDLDGKTFVKIAPGMFDLRDRSNGTGEEKTPETADTASGAAGSPTPVLGR